MNPKPSVTVPATVMRVVDGDTVEVLVQVAVTVRVLDCWAPERYTPDGKQAKLHAESLLPVGQDVLVEVPFRDADQLHDVFSFGRVLGSIYTAEFGSFAKKLISLGYATATRNRPKT